MQPGIGVFSHERFQIGSGFLFRLGLKTWFATAAHVPTGDPEFWRFQDWPTSITLVFDDQRAGRIDLFDAGRRNLFKIPYHPNNQSFSDVLLLDYSEFLASYPTKIYDLSSTQPTDLVGHQATLFGFPEDGSRKRPYWPPHSAKGKITGLVGDKLLGSMSVRLGHSGGPVVDEKGQAMGMAIGSDDDIAAIVPWTILRMTALS
ncbi:hypothetical protein GHK45_23405 [Sinorhizobium meliloti]|uniref:Serine protease n=1 Tax=Rhizobium meliloti TaxID=382 RepID=A0A6A7ZUH7_RHIML|nr:serine protease [Sinorhizobium meliloti]MQW06563.1 hypothetical protein [Sinorhizobium meliloti]